MSAAMTQGAIVAMINAAKRAGTTAGWNSVKPFLAMSPTAIILIDGDDDDERVLEVEEDDDEVEVLYAQA